MRAREGAGILETARCDAPVGSTDSTRSRSAKARDHTARTNRPRIRSAIQPCGGARSERNHPEPTDARFYGSGSRPSALKPRFPMTCKQNRRDLLAFDRSRTRPPSGSAGAPRSSDAPRAHPELAQESLRRQPMLPASDRHNHASGDGRVRHRHGCGSGCATKHRPLNCPQSRTLRGPASESRSRR